MQTLNNRVQKLVLATILSLAGLVLLPTGSYAADDIAVAGEATTAIDTERFRLAAGFDSWVSLEGTRVGEAWQLDGGLWVQASRRPVVFTTDGTAGDAAVPGRVSAIVHAGFNIGSRVRLALDLPLTLYQTGIDPLTQTELAAGGVGDLRLTPLVQVLSAEKYWLGLALSAPISFPTGNKESYLGESGPTIQPKLSLEKRFGFTPRRWLNFSVGVDLGWRFRPKTEILDLEAAGEFTMGLGFRWEPGEIVTVGTEVVSAFGSGDNARHGEWLTWVRLNPGKKKSYRVLAGFAVGLGRGVGTPEGRGYVAFQGTIGLGKTRGGDAGVAEEEYAPSEIVSLPVDVGAQPPRGVYQDGWKLVLLARSVRIPTHILFTEGSAVVTEGVLSDLDEMAAWIRNHPRAGLVTVRGHSGEEGSLEEQLVLSRSRAEAVVEYLVAQGVDRKRLITLELGAEFLPASEEDATPEEVAIASRRVDFKVRLVQ